MTKSRMEKFFGVKRRLGESKMEQIHMDIAASVQKVTEEVVKRMATHLHKITGLDKICMAGGVALNCVANGKVIRETPMKQIFVQPAAGDAGGAIGVALYIYHTLLKNPRKNLDKKFNPFLGPGYTSEEVKKYLQENGIKYDHHEPKELSKKVATLINEQHVIGWFQGRMEFGPRALGNRSIIADARNPKNKDVVNLKIKFRESFRPFAPSVLAERSKDYFDLDIESPYMLLVAPVKEESRTIPSVTHVDHSARVQTIQPEDNPKFYDLIRAFDEETGCPLIINTSFNVRGEPVVMTPHDAYMCFMRTNMDYLVMDDFILDKKDMKPLGDDIDWQNQFELD
jgi:carbamoyltransferase